MKKSNLPLFFWFGEYMVLGPHYNGIILDACTGVEVGLGDGQDPWLSKLVASGQVTER